MRPDPSLVGSSEKLRRRAEDNLGNRPADKVPCDNARLLHELQVHQIELELQNDELILARDAAEEAATRYTDLYDFAPVGYLTLTRTGTIAQTNLAAALLLGSARDDLAGMHLSAWLVDAAVPAFTVFLRQAFLSDARQGCELALCVMGQILTVQLDASVSDNRQECRLALVDITERKQAEGKLQLAASVFTHAHEGIMITDAAGTLIEVNDTFVEITGYSREEAMGQNPRILKSGVQTPEFYAAMWKALADRGHWIGEIWNRSKNGKLYAATQTVSAVRDAAGTTQHYVSLFSDITVLKEHQQQLEHGAHYDALTGLPNRVLLADRLLQAMLQSQRRNKSVAVAYLDLDGFKQINDTYGHGVGDQMLVLLSQHIKEALREGDTLARIGGDEFVAVLVDLESTADCQPVLARLLSAAAQTVTIGEAALQVSASIGVTIYPQDGSDADLLLRHADQAMYIAKDSGKNRYHYFDVKSATALQTRRESLQSIAYALQLNQFVLHYQPKVNMQTGAVVGAEALIRWQHPERGPLAPDLFLPVIENYPLSFAICEWVIASALAQMAAWRAKGLDLPVSVNIGALQLQQDGFAARLAELLSVHPELQPNCLQLEVLETSALEDVARVTKAMKACQALGVGFALDDFGTGYSSLTYLRRLPAETLKIDQSFVRDMLVDPDDLAIVQGVIGLAKSFRRSVIAEGVETAAQGERLLQLGCEMAQGYGISRPMPAADLPAWVQRWQAKPVWTA
jgi:diguanylate cyclase (GGDEF)-like protein/PAS domain S-box-containing protein